MLEQRSLAGPDYTALILDISGDLSPKQFRLSAFKLGSFISEIKLLDKSFAIPLVDVAISYFKI